MFSTEIHFLCIKREVEAYALFKKQINTPVKPIMFPNPISKRKGKVKKVKRMGVLCYNLCSHMKCEKRSPQDSSAEDNRH